MIQSEVEDIIRPPNVKRPFNVTLMTPDAFYDVQSVASENINSCNLEIKKKATW